MVGESQRIPRFWREPGIQSDGREVPTFPKGKNTSLLVSIPGFGSGVIPNQSNV
jgi:hypothetical protein